MIKAALLMMGLSFASFGIAQKNSQDVVGHVSSPAPMIDIALIKNVFQTAEINSAMDDLVRKSIHVSDRRFAHIG